mgnify:CR=1 FL=1
MKTVEAVFKEFPFLRGYKGYGGLILCLQMAAEDEERLTDIRRQLYLPAAQLRGESLCNFEKNLRTVRDAFLMYGGREYLETVLGHKIVLPLYPRELIEAVLECMKEE